MISIDIPKIRQSYPWSCGASCVAATLYYYELWAGREPELYDMLGTTEEDGTAGYKIIEVLGSFGLEATCVKDIDFEYLEGYLKNGQVVMLSVQSPDVEKGTDWAEEWESGHYILLAGLDDTHIWLMDPELPAKYRKMKRVDFEKRWHEYSDEGDKEQHSGIVINRQLAVNIDSAK